MPSQIIKSVPNWFTIGNLLSGIFAITSTMNAYIKIAAIFILLSAVMDFLDGRIARKLKVNSELGVELDSLADVVSFGVAPILLFHTLAVPSLISTLAFIVYPAMGAIRLARFSLKPTVGYFIGIPIPAAGLSMAAMSFFYYSNSLITIILAALMVSPIRVKKF
ncbi:MAG: CDP-diacylglycerol--serine O-phosphatidyltransferase [Bacillota bacterium]|nr:CDP-diacylglycerol--serine O-phosphatidyltransferase [Bacillota bacterium]